MPGQHALLVIDVQRALCEGEFEAFDVAGVIERINAVADRARRAGAPVVFVQHETKEGPFRHGTDGWQLAAGLVAAAQDLRVRKTTPDSFLRTELGRVLEEREVRSLAICGLQTEFCVDTTTRRALALGYPVVLVADAHSTLASEHLSAAQIIRHHNATLASISSFGPRVVPVVAAEVRFAA